MRGFFILGPEGSLYFGVYDSERRLGCAVQVRDNSDPGAAFRLCAMLLDVMEEEGRLNDRRSEK